MNLAQIKSMFIPDQTDMPGRKYDLDGLRVMAFGLLIFFHVGMFYIEAWSWHVKSSYLVSGLENAMLLVEPWRMPLLWCISGISIRFILAKVSLSRFIVLRTYRLLLPLAFGVLIVVPPQLYYEMTANGDLNMGYWEFTRHFFDLNSPVFENYQAGILPHMDVNHLWFLRSLWRYSLGLLLLLPLLNSAWVTKATDWLFSRPGPLALVFAIAPVLILQLSWDQDTVRYPLGFTFLLYGYLIGWNRLFWNKLAGSFLTLLATTLMLYVVLLIGYNLYWVDAASSGTELPIYLKISLVAIYSSSKVIGVMMAFAFALTFLTSKSKRVDYLNQAVYPFYILHQTFIIVIGVNLNQFELGVVTESILLIALTTVSCFISFEIIRNVEWLKPFFGIKLAKLYSPRTVNMGYAVSLVMLSPLALRLLT